MLLASSPVSFAATPQEPAELIPVGKAVGIKMFSDGVMVVGISPIIENGRERSPAKDSGIKPGDIIMAVGGKKVSSTAELKRAAEVGGTLKITVMRGEKPLSFQVTPIKADDGSMKLGAWVRDSMAGIGTVTFYDPQSGVFGALGHGINDVDTAQLMPLARGSLVKSEIESVRKGEAGIPGELKGSFDLKSEFGSLYANTESGVFGTVKPSEVQPEREPVPVAKKTEIETGRATILSNVYGDTVEEYEIEITHIYLEGSKTPRDMTIKVTDKRLIEKTGGIVQGMSGSPILQNGKIIGAVTHVLINEPTRGYAIFIENMIGAEMENKGKNAA